MNSKFLNSEFRIIQLVMNKRRSSEDRASPTATRKKLSSQFLNRLKPSLEIFSSTPASRPEPRGSRNTPSTSTNSISNIIQSKVANLKHKFGELDNMRKRLIESRCENRDETESKLSTLNRTRPLSNDSYTDSLFSDFPAKIRTFSFEKYEEELHNERKSTQKAILEKNLLEREGQERIDSLKIIVNRLNKDADKLSRELEGTERKLKECEIVKNEYEREISVLKHNETVHNQQVLDHNSTIKKLQKEVKDLKSKLNTAKEGFSNGTVQNLSNIILSSSVYTGSDSPKKEATQVVTRHLATLQDLLSADQFSLQLIQELEKKNFPKVEKLILGAKKEIFSRYNKTCSIIEEYEKPLENFKSFSTIHRSFLQDYPEPQNPSQEDFLSWIKCQAATIEELLIIST